MLLRSELDDTTFIFHRAANLRSAGNVWSTPSGMHDIGETVEQTIIKELNEEFGLGDEVINFEPVFQYENIAGDPLFNQDGSPRLQYHWVISVYEVCMGRLDKYVNKEPSKHDSTVILPWSIWFDEDTYNTYKFHPTYEAALREHFIGS
jgi:8-oxo-dGTP pyrophosphatase MutT (NUDIX family)